MDFLKSVGMGRELPGSERAFSDQLVKVHFALVSDFCYYYLLLEGHYLLPIPLVSSSLVFLSKNPSPLLWSTNNFMKLLSWLSNSLTENADYHSYLNSLMLLIVLLHFQLPLSINPSILLENI